MITRTLLFGYGSCCPQCRTPTGGCATRYQCEHHAEHMDSVVQRLYERDKGTIGELEAREKFETGQYIPYTLSILHEANVPFEESLEVALEKHEYARQHVEELFEIDVSENAFIGARIAHGFRRFIAEGGDLRDFE